MQQIRIWLSCGKAAIAWQWRPNLPLGIHSPSWGHESKVGIRWHGSPAANPADENCPLGEKNGICLIGIGSPIMSL